MRPEYGSLTKILLEHIEKNKIDINQSVDNRKIAKEIGFTNIQVGNALSYIRKKIGVDTRQLTTAGIQHNQSVFDRVVMTQHMAMTAMTELSDHVKHLTNVVYQQQQDAAKVNKFMKNMEGMFRK